MMKSTRTLLLCICLFSVKASLSQNNISYAGHGESASYGRVFESFLGEYDGKYYFAEEHSDKKKRFVDVVLSIRIVDKESLKTLKTKGYEDITTAFKETRFDYGAILMRHDKIKILAFDWQTGNLVFIQVNPITLELMPNIEKVYSIKDYYDISEKAFSKKLKKRNWGISFSTEISESKSKEYSVIYVWFSLVKVKNSTAGLGILIDEKFRVRYVNVFDNYDVPQQRWQERYLVSDNGTAVVGFNQDWVRKPGSDKIEGIGSAFWVFNTKGEKSVKKLKRPESLEEIGNHPHSLEFEIDNDRLYVAGYNSKRTGYLFGVFDLTSTEEHYNLKFREFSNKTQALFKTSDSEELPKLVREVDRYETGYIEDKLAPQNIVILDDGDILLTGRYRYQASVGDGYMLYHDNLMITKIGMDAQIDYTKILLYEQKGLFFKLAGSKPIVVDDRLFLLINMPCKEVEGYNLKGEGKEKNGGTVVSINTKDMSWEKIPYILPGTLEELVVIPHLFIRESPKSYVYPCKPMEGNEVGYVRVKFNE